MASSVARARAISVALVRRAMQLGDGAVYADRQAKIVRIEDEARGHG